MHCSDMTVADVSAGKGSKRTLTPAHRAVIEFVGVLRMCLSYVPFAVRIVLETPSAVATPFGLDVLIVMLPMLV